MANAFRYKPGIIVNALKSPITISSSGKDTEVVALWDTGATICCVSQDVINTLSLVPTGKARMSTPSSVDELTDTYLVDLMLPNDILVKDVVVAKSKIGSQGIGLLVGMDIISRGDFLITNTGETVFSFRMPSEPLPDFATGINMRNVIGKSHGGRKPPTRRRK